MDQDKEKIGVLVHSQVDEFSIECLIGRGGASEVYRAQDNRTDTTVALKFLLPSRLEDQQANARLRSEANHILKLRHRNIVTVLDVRESPTAGPYLVMELINGRSLTECIPLPEKKALEVCSQVADALAYAHGTGMIHRDIKPSNIMLLEDSSVRLVDFGLARVFEKENPDHIPLTRTREVVGTPLYMSPEQCFGQEVGVTSDTYQLGCLLFQCLTGYPPFEGSTSFEAMYKHVSAQPDLKTMPPAIKNILAKALDKNPAARFQTAGEMGQCLRDAISGRSTVPIKTSAPVLSRVGLLLLVACLAAIPGFYFLSTFSQHDPAPSSTSTVEAALTPIQLEAQKFYQQGVDFKTKGWTERSREALTKAIQLDKGTVGFKALSYLRAKLPAHVQTPDAEQMNIYAYNLSYGGKREEAEKVWKECIAKYPNFEWPYSNLAAEYMDVGNWEKAAALLERAIDINPYYTNALRNMSEVQLKLGRPDLARKFMQAAADSAPDDPSFQAALSALQK